MFDDLKHLIMTSIQKTRNQEGWQTLGGQEVEQAVWNLTPQFTDFWSLSAFTYIYYGIRDKLEVIILPKQTVKCRLEQTVFRLHHPPTFQLLDDLLYLLRYSHPQICKHDANTVLAAVSSAHRNCVVPTLP